MIPGQISSLPKPKDRRIGSCCLFEAKVYVALTFKVLSWLDLKYEVGADDCKMLLAGRKPLDGINLVGN